MSLPTVYLAGQITDLTYDDAKSWRDVAARALRVGGIAPICPMRAQEHLRAQGVLVGSYEDHVTTTARAIMHRDHYDCHRCDVVIANVLDMDRTSAGTTMELAWAYHAHKPVILVERAGGIHCSHPMIAESVTYRVDTVAEAVRLAVALLEDYG